MGPAQCLALRSAALSPNGSLPARLMPLTRVRSGGCTQFVTHCCHTPAALGSAVRGCCVPLHSTLHVEKIAMIPTAMVASGGSTQTAVQQQASTLAAAPLAAPQMKQPVACPLWPGRRGWALCGSCVCFIVPLHVSMRSAMHPCSAPRTVLAVTCNALLAYTAHLHRYRTTAVHT